MLLDMKYVNNVFSIIFFAYPANVCFFDFLDKYRLSIGIVLLVDVVFLLRLAVDGCFLFFFFSSFTLQFRIFLSNIVCNAAFRFYFVFFFFAISLFVGF